MSRACGRTSLRWINRTGAARNLPLAGFVRGCTLVDEHNRSELRRCRARPRQFGRTGRPRRRCARNRGAVGRRRELRPTPWSSGCWRGARSNSHNWPKPRSASRNRRESRRRTGAKAEGAAARSAPRSRFPRRAGPAPRRGNRPSRRCPRPCRHRPRGYGGSRRPASNAALRSRSCRRAWSRGPSS